MDDNKITLYSENGESKEYEILFTYEDDDANYVFYYENDDSPVFVSKFDLEGHIYPIEDMDEWDKVEALLASYGENSVAEDACQDGCDENKE